MDEFKELESGMNIIYRWKNPASYDHRLKHNEAEEYVVVEEKEANSGIVVYGLFGDGWSPNPWSTRPLIRQLQTELDNYRKAINAINQAGKLYTDQFATILDAVPPKGVTVNWDKSIKPILKQILGDNYEQALKEE